MKTVSIIGAGIDGLATARAIGLENEVNIIMLEQHAKPATETSARNSGVMHAGIYYQEGSLKDAFCAPGNRLLKEYCERNTIPHRITGKFIVADQRQQLETIAANARRHAIPVELLTQNETRRRSSNRAAQPNIRCAHALYVPTTGVVDTEALARQLAHDFEQSGPGERLLLAGAKVVAIRGKGPYEIDVIRQREGRSSFEETVETDYVINAAGLWAPTIAELMDIDEYTAIASFVKGSYWTIRRDLGVDTLVYPLPTEHSLGIHYTVDVEGNARLGPDAERLLMLRPNDFPRNVYAVRDTDADRERFFQAAQAYLPDLRIDDIMPGTAGIRPQMRLPKEQRDFIIRDEADKGKPGVITKAFIESPGITSIFPSATYVNALLKTQL